jgi:hypothetical protein
MLTTWHQTFTEPVSVGKIGAATANPVRDLLLDAGVWNARAAGKRLKKLEKRVVAGYKLQSKLREGVRLWWVTLNGRLKQIAPERNPGW